MNPENTTNGAANSCEVLRVQDCELDLADGEMRVVFRLTLVHHDDRPPPIVPRHTLSVSLPASRNPPNSRP